MPASYLTSPPHEDDIIERAPAAESTWFVIRGENDRAGRERTFNGKRRSRISVKDFSPVCFVTQIHLVRRRQTAMALSGEAP